MLNNLNPVFKCFLYLFLFHLQLTKSTQVLRPRGVSLQKKLFYDPNQDFTCLDGSLSIPFHFVNDDYCDCLDGSDEPGTAACLNGFFYCLNLGYVEKNIPSSRVNDGVCDCCDGSDEYNSTANCVDNCEELGREALEEAKRLEKLFGTGSQIREKYIEEGKQKRFEFMAKLEELKAQLEALESVKKEKKAVQDEMEEKERQALDKYKKINEEKKKLAEEKEIQQSQMNEKNLAINAFKEFDVNNDGLLTYFELQQFSKFDQNEDGIVEKEEAKFFLHMKDEMDLEEFVSIGWVIMKPLYLKDKNIAEDQIESNKNFVREEFLDQNEVEKVKEEEELLEKVKMEEEEKLAKEIEMVKKNKDKEYGEENNNDYEEEEEIEVEKNIEKEREDDDDGDGDEEDEEVTLDQKMLDKDIINDTVAPAENETEYDDETKKLIEQAEKAKKEYSEIELQYSNLNKRTQELEQLLNFDLGPDGEFYILHGQCFEYTDNEYTYKFCPFVKASQRPKDVETETLLGQWGQWSGELDKKYNRQRYPKGITCWNGPERSVDVHLKCGLENQLLTVKEPSRCEYLFEFETPALCKKSEISQSKDKHQHLEL